MLKELRQKHDKAVVLISDDNYLPAALFVAQKIVMQKTIDFDILILTIGPVRSLPPIDPRIQILPWELDQRLEGKSSHHFRSSATYARLSLASILYPSYRRVLYLDCDLWIGTRPLSDLFNADLQGKAIGAARDASEIRKRPCSAWRRYKKHVGLASDILYFNAGVLLIDMEKFAQQNIGERAINYIAQGNPLGGYDDQTALNIIVNGQWAELSPVWNWMFSPRRHLTRKINPGTIHFAGRSKPWVDVKGKHDPVYRNEMRAVLSAFGLADFVKTYPRKFSHIFRTIASLLPRSRDSLVRAYTRKTNFVA